MTRKSIMLDGEWDFFYSPQKFIPGTTPIPPIEQFTGKMAVPGYWDDHLELIDEEDFFGLTARFNPDYRPVHFPMARTLCPHACTSFLVGTGFYRTVLPASVDCKGQPVLNVGPAVWDCAVYCNRQLAGVAEGYSTASEFDLSCFFRHGEENEIVIVVCNVHDDGGAYCRVDGSHDGQYRGARAGQHRGLVVQGYQSERAGIGGGVSLTLNEAGRISDFYASSEDGRPHWHVRLEYAAGAMLLWSVSKDGTVLENGSQPCNGEWVNWTSGRLPERWSDSNPLLYDMTVQLADEAGMVWDERHWKWAPRVLKVSGRRILVNDVPVYFNGVTEHCYFAETTNAHFDTAKYLRDLGKLKTAGFNFIRCHTWCPPEPFYDACDQLGFYVQTELPVMYRFEEAQAILKMLRRHASAVILCDGNEKILDGSAMMRMRRLVDMMHEMAPGMLFNPQEALRGIEYEFSPEQRFVKEPLWYDPARLAALEPFSDVYGSLGVFFSYANDEFPGTEEIDKTLDVYGRPCLNHEAGILGGYIDFSLEPRYEDTYIGTDMFRAARKNMKKHGIWQNARLYYEKNCLFISSVRKQLIENMRSCSNLAGYDYLGGIDTHWHLNGYPCGILNEFYEEKYGETIADVHRYVAPSILLCRAGNRRNRFAGTEFSEEIRLAYFGEAIQGAGKLQWSFAYLPGKAIASGECDFADVEPGTVSTIGTATVQLPDEGTAYMAVLKVQAVLNGRTIENVWKFWVFPRAEKAVPANVRISGCLCQEDIDFAAQGGAVLLTGGFPAGTDTEMFRTHTSGRSLGHAGSILHKHPVWNAFPQEGFGDWQFFPMMMYSTSMVNDSEMPAFDPIMELIPSFKLVRRKSMIAEFKVGAGRLMTCGLNQLPDEPASQWLRHVLVDYLANAEGWTKHVNEWAPEKLAMRIGFEPAKAKLVPVDEGGRPIF